MINYTHFQMVKRYLKTQSPFLLRKGCDRPFQARTRPILISQEQPFAEEFLELAVQILEL
jgi:hypothetical protein